jgi:hypothetical protein
LLARLPAPVFVAALSIVALIVGWTAGRAHSKRVDRPTTVTAAVARLEAVGLADHVVGLNPQGGLAQGAFVCDRPRTRKELWLLRRAAKAPGWAGVLLILPLTSTDPHFADNLREWDEMATSVPPLLLFGDPALVRRAAIELGR